MTHSSGRYLSFTWEQSINRVATVTDPAGNVYGYGYLTVGYQGRLYFGYLQIVELPNALGTRAYLLDLNEDTYAQRPYQLRGIYVNNLRHTRYDYHPDGRVKRSGPAVAVDGVEDFGPGSQSFAYASTYTDVTNNRGAVSRYEYRDVGGRQKRVQVTRSDVIGAPVANEQTFYDANGFPDYEFDFNGNETDYLYNARGQLEVQVIGKNDAFPAQHRRTEFDWHPTLNRIEAVREYGVSRVKPVSETVYRYYAVGSGFDHRIESISIYNRSTNYGVADQERKYGFVYTLHPNKLLETVRINGPQPGSGDTQVFTFDDQGDLIRVADAVGNITRYAEHNGLGLPGTVTDPNNTVTELVYNGRGQLETSTAKLGAGDRLTRFEYHPVGMISKITRPDSSVQEFVHDSAGYLREAFARPSATGSPGPVTRYGYDFLGNVELEERQQSGVTHYSLRREYNAISNLAAEVRNNNQRTEYGYDNNGNVTSILQKGGTAAADRMTQLFYDSHDRVRKVTDPLNQETVYTYDDGGNLETVTDPKRLLTTYHHDGFGNRVKQISRDTGTTTYVYDAAGNRERMTTKELAPFVCTAGLNL